ncbi:MAG: TPM domain-containing protein [Bacteroidales bacterium]|nr:TPM domain-containing protein [Bacteroidales bacterium]MDE6146927.1 TPM domain-containing protein [Bacteroidales bacterium]
MKKYIKYIIAAAIIAAASVNSSAIPGKPVPERLVNDFAGLFTASETAALERVLTAFDDSTSNQIAVVTVNDLEGYEPAEYATRIGIGWQVGSKDFNNGIVILVKPKDSSPGKVFIAVGYGLEGAIPDAYAKRIIDSEMIPRFAANDYFGGVSAGCAVLMKLASGEISEPRGHEDEDIPWQIGLVLALLFVIIILWIAKKNGGDGPNRGRRRVIYTGPIITGRGHGFGGGHGSGGFGGFGGGSFGGGGAGGSW